MRKQNLEKILKDYFSSTENAIEKIAKFHANFEKIHPFNDGNGRTGRFLIVHSCLKEGLEPIIIPKEEKGRYINLLSSENVKELTKWGLELQEKEKERVKKFFNKEKDN